MCTLTMAKYKEIKEREEGRREGKPGKEKVSEIRGEERGERRLEIGEFHV